MEENQEKKRVLVITTSLNGDGDSILSDARFTNCKVHHLLQNNNYQEELDSFAENSFQECYVFYVVPTDELFASILRILIPKGKLLLEKQIPDRVTGQNICSDLQIAGFVDTMAAKDPSTGERFVVCQKPSWTTTETATITLPETKWKMNLNDLTESDLVDESELLDDGISAPTNVSCGEASTRKRACKDCSCGFAEELEAAAATTSESTSLPNKSACGSCYKGDAFRCASCPFLGKPAFEPTNSNRVVLAGTDDL